MVEKSEAANPLVGYDRCFESRARLEIMSVLAVNGTYEYSGLKALLGLTDGNLTSHLRSLEKAGYVEFRKRFVGRKPNTVYRATSKGKEAFARHLSALEALCHSLALNDNE